MNRFHTDQLIFAIVLAAAILSAIIYRVFHAY
jgi:hypothetical protein